MKVLGIILTIIGVITIIASCSMDTSVPVGLTGERVNNIGLMRDQSNYMLIGGISFIAGIILWSIGSFRRKKSIHYGANANAEYLIALGKLADLKDRGALTDEEFKQQKKELLNNQIASPEKLIENKKSGIEERNKLSPQEVKSVRRSAGIGVAIIIFIIAIAIIALTVIHFNSSQDKTIASNTNPVSKKIDGHMSFSAMCKKAVMAGKASAIDGKHSPDHSFITSVGDLSANDNYVSTLELYELQAFNDQNQQPKKQGQKDTSLGDEVKTCTSDMSNM
ncbi:hypothetical protein LMG33818_000879 [Halomonadaceae bacterium LMG 33818]|uniref:SHOCT domain-containing protein n=1 Tax=Cernens ardua TaxID=3402176 RepID=UPI003EDC1E1D